MARIKKLDPELLLVSFCDILTISISALFMATIITVFEATKVPELSMTPKAVPTSKSAVFFECRTGELYFIDKEGLDTQISRLLSTLSPNVKSGDITQFLKALQGQEIGNEHYKVLPSYLLTAVIALEPRTGVPGFNSESLDNPASRFRSVLSQIDKDKYYIAFLVRDDSFSIFRKARLVADKLGYDVGWELLGAGEPIKFGAGGTSIGVSG